jgi:hypothetical protein
MLIESFCVSIESPWWWHDIMVSQWTHHIPMTPLWLSIRYNHGIMFDRDECILSQTSPPEVQATFYLIRKSGLIRCVELQIRHKRKGEPNPSARVCFFCFSRHGTTHTPPVHLLIIFRFRNWLGTGTRSKDVFPASVALCRLLRTMKVQGL